jgi:hypothetical protein
MAGLCERQINRRAAGLPFRRKEGVMKALYTSGETKNGRAARRQATDEADTVDDQAAECIALARFADDGGSWRQPPGVESPACDASSKSAWK